MVEKLEGSRCGIKTSSAVFRMAARASIDCRDLAVNPLTSFYLRVNLDMAIKASRRQVGRQWIMAVATLLLKIGM